MTNITISDRPPLGRALGMHVDVPESVYHAPAPGVVSKSALDRVNRSPAHYLHWLTEPQKDDTAALAFGRAFHCAILEPAKFAEQYITEPDFGDMRSSKNRDKRDGWRYLHAGQNFLSAEDAAQIGAMRDALLAHKLVRSMLVGGIPEVTLTWQDAETGLYCKSRADYYVPERAMVVDLKTTQDASHDEFRRSIAKYRYHVQDALYRDAFGKVGQPIAHFLMVAVEKSAPHGVAVYTLDADGIARGYNAARTNIEQLAEAVRSNDWRGYPEKIDTIDLPPWAA